MSISLQKDIESESHPSELSENRRKGSACWGDRPEREGQIKKLIGDQNPSLEPPPRSKTWQERRVQMRCQERSDGEE